MRQSKPLRPQSAPFLPKGKGHVGTDKGLRWPGITAGLPDQKKNS